MTKRDGEQEAATPDQADVGQRPPAPGADAEEQAIFPIVGIGASAGGLSALQRLFSRVPPDSGVAFVIVMHLSPEHDSHVQELLQPHANLPVTQVTETIRLEPDAVYVIPPNANLDSVDTHLRLTELEARRSERAPIDHFFRTLAATHGSNAIGIVLSGTGSDGTLGLKRIKEAGGLTIAQDPAEAEYDGMPQSAIAGAPVDLVLPLLDIPGAVLRFVRTRPELEVPEDDEARPAAERLFREVLAVLRTRTGRDFGYYKPTTVLRRISRRMQFNNISDPEVYLGLLRAQPAEAVGLADDLLINVTRFFRDAEVFAALERNVIPQLFERKGAGDNIRVWSVGCATGEEAYSLAMLLLEEAAKRDSSPSIQVFASDLHARSLDRAREGLYPGDIEADVGSERIIRFFEKESGGYRIKKAVREIVIFAPHNLLADPPFSRLDLISCRNLLIYLERSLQPQVVELFHYALRESGFIVLGTAEYIDNGDLFRVENKKAAIYRKRNVPGPEPRLPVFPLAQAGAAGHTLRSGSPGSRDVNAYGALHQHLVEQYGPPSILLSPDDNAVHSSANAGRYLVHPGGPPTANIFRLLPEELRTELRSALAVARSELRTVRTAPVTTTCHGESIELRLEVRPAVSTDQEGFVVLLFDEHSHVESGVAEGGPSAAGGRNQGADRADDPASTVRKLETDKAHAEHRLQRLIEEHETSREELRASNEELQSANEELRSTLEELETSKEELQSMNEELQTVNQENRHKVDELNRLSSDLQNLLVATDIATLFLDRDNRILRFTPRIEQLFNIRTADRGRALSDFTTRLGYDQLASDASVVLQQLVQIEREVRDESGSWYLARVSPYRDVKDRIAGVVVTFVEITGLKRAEEEVRLAKETSELIIEGLPEPLLVLTSELVVRSANAAFCHHFRTQAEAIRGRRVYEIGNGEWNIPALRSLLEGVLPDNEEFRDYQVDHEFDELGRRVMLLNARRMDHRNLILLGFHDITSRHESEQALRDSEARFRALVTASSQAMYRMSPDWREMRQLHARGFLAEPRQPSSSWIVEYIPAEERPRVTAAIEAALRNKAVFDLEHRVRRADGSIGWASSRAVPLLDDDGNITEWFGVASDITQRREAEEHLRVSDRRKDDYLAMLGHELRNPLGAMRNATEVLRATSLEDERAIRACRVLRRQITRMSTITDDLLDVSRIARGKMRLRFAVIDLCQVVRGVLDAHGKDITSRDLKLETKIGTDPVWVSGDESRLAQVFDNLLSNAIKFTASEGTLWVGIDVDEASVAVRVRDTGVGIRPERLSRIFDSFQQGAQDVSRSDGGLGLGLSLAKGLIDLHHGSLEARSDGRGHGAEFVVRLPLAESAPPVSTAPPESTTAQARVLIVEDNEDAAQTLRDLLELQGHDVAVVQDGRAALAWLEQQHADVVVCDVGLPGMSGLDVARAIRRHPRLRDMVLIAMTGYGQARDRTQTEAAGFDAHLTKPVDLTALNEAMCAPVAARRP